MRGTSDPGEGKEGRYLLLDIGVSFSNVGWVRFRRKEELVSAGLAFIYGLSKVSVC